MWVIFRNSCRGRFFTPVCEHGIMQHKGVRSMRDRGGPIDGYWWVLGIGVLNPVGIGYWSFGLARYWVLEF